MEWRDHPLDATNPYQSGYDPQARHLAKTQSGLWIVFKLAFKILVYSPLLLSGYWLSQKILPKDSEKLLWFLLPVVFAIILYQVLKQCKQFIIRSKQKGKWGWLPLFIACVAFTCLLPAYLAFELVNPVIQKINGSQIFTYLLIGGFTLYVYFQYDFLSHQSSRTGQ